MIRNLLVTFEEDRNGLWYDNGERTTSKNRFSNIEQAQEVAKRNKENNCIILDTKEMNEEELDQWLTDEINQYNSNKFVKIHKISNLQIVEYISTFEDKEEIVFRAYRDYEEITRYVYHNLEECLLSALINKNLEWNEAAYAHDFVKRMIKWE